MADLLPIFLVFLIAGAVKGVAGFGLPTVSIALLALFRPLPEAIALMLVPSLATNVWQAMAGGTLATVAPRIGVFLLSAAGAAFLAAGHLARADAVLLSGMLGVVLVGSSALALAAPQLPAPSPRAERWLAPPMGAVSGAIAGFTGSFLVPAAPWLQAIRLPREQFVQGFGLGVVLVNGAMAAGLSGAGLLPAHLGLMSLAGLLPAFAGMEVGRRLRQRLNEAAFRRVVQVALGLLGAWLAVRALA
ncbi:sulfite exporter TauE/SafE family protein [Neoroseomonas oryzicola]|uniref:Probable membrane transporter protein n=1 Tax=Neoroseomonas oryzicola TaxID=535904 RepID=A0A9X9WKY9_9PROT|nr:sulfite exporter TauE/SafE family protein [Neoroseomonas oryzicola]MBR0660999.1 sulfite exporter TauE/SafE family protein [Neoroseomonas oryzicola]NKE19210.1 sulfite exporter TauE/SafE family protein [Neoroseomonas oryzicola]